LPQSLNCPPHAVGQSPLPFWATVYTQTDIFDLGVHSSLNFRPNAAPLQVVTHPGSTFFQGLLLIPNVPVDRALD